MLCRSAAPPTKHQMQGHASRHVPVANPRLLSIALCVDGAPVYDAAGCALTARCPLEQPHPFPFSTAESTAKPDMRSGSEPSRRIDLRGVLDAQTQCMSLRLPGEEVAGGSGVGSASVAIADGSGEELQKTLGGAIASLSDDGGHDCAAGAGGDSAWGRSDQFIRHRVSLRIC